MKNVKNLVKKALAVALVGFVGFVGMASCGGSKEETKEPVKQEQQVEEKEEEKEKKVTIEQIKATVKSTCIPEIIKSLQIISDNSMKASRGEISANEYNHELLDMEYNLTTKYLIPEETIAQAENNEVKKIMLQNNKVIKMICSASRNSREGFKKGDLKRIEKGVQIMKKVNVEGKKLIEMTK